MIIYQILLVKSKMWLTVLMILEMILLSLLTVKIIRSGEKNKVVMFSSDYNTDEATDNCWSEIDIQPCLQIFFCIFRLQMF